MLLIYMKIGIGQVNPTIGDFAGNRTKILDAAGRGVEDGVALD